jgi:hypothetical protein
MILGRLHNIAIKFGKFDSQFRTAYALKHAKTCNPSSDVHRIQNTPPTFLFNPINPLVRTLERWYGLALSLIQGSTNNLPVT